MSAALLTQLTVRRVIGAARLNRLLRAGGLKPVERTPSRILYSPRDIHRALRRLERQVCPPDKIESIRVARSRERNGHAYVPVPKKDKTPVWNLDFSAFQPQKNSETLPAVII
jgi:hypothetical protein